MLRSPNGLATAVTVLLSVVIAVDVFAVLADLNMYSLMGRIMSDGAGAVTQADRDRGDALYGVSALLQILTLLATAVVFIVWFHRTRVNAEVFAPHAFTKGRGWAIGSWFVPIGNLFLPRRIAREIWDASTQAAPDGSWRQASQAPLNLWWSLWIASTVLGRIAGNVYDTAEEADAIQQASAVMSASDLLDVASAVFAILFVRKLSGMQHIKATQGPVALT
ncbi:DUF4328 domain-containing protein [Streptomyces sp. NBC_01537]|uniref:DUF4328 domain-containing protein n=1 Tax=Streptomyces sp. NBC_01537 TaxID=2903896 RepID=UPI0038657BD5